MIRLLGGVIIALFPAAAWAGVENPPSQGGPQGGIAGMLMPIALMIVILYFLVYRPQKKKQQQHDQMISSISRGDTVITAGGFFGRVLDVLDDSYILELDEGVKARILKSSVQNKREGDDKSRPKKLRKKRRIVRRDIPAESGKPVEAGETAKIAETAETPLEEGVSMEENDALIGKLDDNSGQSDKVKREHIDSDGGIR